MTEDGQPRRHNTYIDIPDSLRLPRFMLADGADEGEDESAGLERDYKLVLQSVICHRGDCLQSGHYISFARVAPKLLTNNRRHDFDPPPDYEEAQWVQFDDNDFDQRVRYVDNVKEALKFEMPYLLFYQVVPMVDSPSSAEDTDTEPPSYEEFRDSVDMVSTPTAPQSTGNGVNHDESATPTVPAIHTPPSQSSSVRFSTEWDRSRQGSDATGPFPSTISAQDESRRPSTSLTGSAAHTPSRTPDAQHSPLMSPADESTASRLSRAAARFKGRQSRPSSQYGENRVGHAMSRMAGLMMRPSKDALNEPTVLTISQSHPGERLSLDEPPISEHTETLSDNETTTQGASRDGSQKLVTKTNGKAKEKVEKSRSGQQPERECLVM